MNKNERGKMVQIYTGQNKVRAKILKTFEDNANKKGSKPSNEIFVAMDLYNKENSDDKRR